MALGIADQVWTIGDLLDAALATQPITPRNYCAGSAQAVQGNRTRPSFGTPRACWTLLQVV
jgi:hypothetical protein